MKPKHRIDSPPLRTPARCCRTGILILTSVLLSACGADIVGFWIIHGHPYKTRRQQERERIERLEKRRRIEGIFAGAEIVHPIPVTVVTDTATLEFPEGMSGIAYRDGKAFLHGTPYAAYGIGTEYLVIPFTRVRRISFDWPLNIQLKDAGWIHCGKGTWTACYVNGTLAYFLVASTTADGSGERAIPADSISAVLDGTYALPGDDGLTR